MHFGLTASSTTGWSNDLHPMSLGYSCGITHTFSPPCSVPTVVRRVVLAPPPRTNFFASSCSTAPLPSFAGSTLPQPCSTRDRAYMVRHPFASSYPLSFCSRRSVFLCESPNILTKPCSVAMVLIEASASVYINRPAPSSALLSFFSLFLHRSTTFLLTHNQH